MDDLLTTLYDHYHVPFVDRRLGNIIERDHQKLIKELSNRQRKLVLEIIDCKDSYVEEAAKMMSIAVTEEPRGGQEAYEKLDMAVYSRKVFGMFSGEEQTVQLRFANYLVGAVLDRLGRDVMIIPDGGEHFTVRTNVVVSPQFFAWVCGFGDGVQILAPEDVVAAMKEHVEKIVKQYTN